jgi:ABC-type transport system involved in cytochrome c biogenesis permease subunit
LGIVLEKIYRNGVGSMVASVIGFVTLIIAHHLMAQGDTLEMMRAVLDSNFWLATHVVCITIGYSSTFLAGFLGVFYVFRKAFDRSWNNKTATELERMVYGIVCFSLLFSFVGTILGGIWADQSWGRFWGWDPKENGALMIVLWNAFVLHARLAKQAKPRDFVVMAVFGNIVTALSWFGVNMLGIGLHSYGWMDKAFNWLALFIATQMAVIILGLWSPQPTHHTYHHKKEPE